MLFERCGPSARHSPLTKGTVCPPPKSQSQIHPPPTPTCHPHAAGIDIGAREIWVAVPPGSDPKPVRGFDTFTEDLLKLRDWLLACASKPWPWNPPRLWIPCQIPKPPAGSLPGQRPPL